MTARHPGGRSINDAKQSDSIEKSEMPVSAYLTTVSTELTASQLAGVRRRLADLLAEHGIVLHVVKRQKSVVSAILRAVKGQPGVPVAVIDEETANPAETMWLRVLRKQTDSPETGVPPQIIYVTRQATAGGTAQAQLYSLVRGYVLRDDKGRWIETVADKIIELLKTPGQTSTVATAHTPSAQAIPGIVGTSHCFREAVGRLVNIFDAPCGLVTGEVGTGKMFLIRSMYQHRFGAGVRMTVLPCGIFFKDYYIGERRRRLAGDKDSFERLKWYLEQAQDSVLVLHHVERLPTAVQDELATVLQESAANPANPARIARVVKGDIDEYDVQVIATSTLPPELLAQTGRMLPELVRRLAKHHVRIPPLRERGPEDVRLLAGQILPRIAASQGRPVPEIEEDALAALERTAWPNNISDLVRALEHACRECRRGTITRDDLPQWLDTSRKVKGPFTLDEIVAQTQRTVILNAIDCAGGDIAAAARMLGRNPKGLYRLMKSLGLKTKRL